MEINIEKQDNIRYSLCMEVSQSRDLVEVKKDSRTNTRTILIVEQIYRLGFRFGFKILFISAVMLPL